MFVLPTMLAAMRLGRAMATDAAMADVYGLTEAEVRQARDDARRWNHLRRAAPEAVGVATCADIAATWDEVHRRANFTVDGNTARFREAGRTIISRLLPPPARRDEELTIFSPRFELRGGEPAGARYEIKPESFARAAEFNPLMVKNGTVRWFDDEWLVGTDAVNAWGRAVEQALRLAVLLTVSPGWPSSRYQDLLYRLGGALKELQQDG